MDELRQNVVVASLEQKTEWQKLLQELVWNEAMSLCTKRFSAQNRKHDVRSLTEFDKDNLRFNDISAGELDLFEKMFLAEEVQKVIATLPPKQQELCELLKHYFIGEVCERLGLRSRTQLHRMCEALKGVFIAAEVFSTDDVHAIAAFVLEKTERLNHGARIDSVFRGSGNAYPDS